MKTITAYDNPALNSAITKSWKRLVPLMFILYFIAFIDRVNVGFAKEAMQVDIGLSNSAFALGAGIFFAAYALFGIPANLILNKIGRAKMVKHHHRAVGRSLCPHRTGADGNPVYCSALFYWG
ncbi:nitrate/nitrite transporter [Klebsiella michiganensis]|nr:nitrate/nitrite transporter [Klebsiella michiganensis]